MESEWDIRHHDLLSQWVSAAGGYKASEAGDESDDKFRNK